MNKYELWIMVVGGEDDDERLIYQGNSLKELDNAVLDYNEEVITDLDKYFELSTKNESYTFYSYADFLDLVNNTGF